MTNKHEHRFYWPLSRPFFGGLLRRGYLRYMGVGCNRVPATTVIVGRADILLSAWCHRLWQSMWSLSVNFASRARTVAAIDTSLSLHGCSRSHKVILILDRRWSLIILLQFFHIKSYGNIPTGKLNGGVECSWYEKWHFRPVSRFTSKWYKIGL